VQRGPTHLVPSFPLAAAAALAYMRANAHLGKIALTA
jgi:hypothetical protein